MSDSGALDGLTMQDILLQHSMPEVLHHHFAGFTPDLFAHVAAEASGLDRFLESLLENHGPDQFLVEASVRKLWQQCREASKPSFPPPAPSGLPAGDSWSDPFPAKLSAATWKLLRESFLSAYPSELLSPEETPSSRLMALVYKGVQDKSLKWPHWRHRLSAAQEQAHQLQRPTKVPRLESLLFDEVPAKEVPSQLSYSYVASALSLHANALALCKAAHLGVLKKYVQAFLKLCFPQTESGWRGPSAAEALAADEKAWSAINDLFANHGWALGDAVLEIVDVRTILHVHLQPRLLAPPPPAPFRTGGAFAKSRGKDKGAHAKPFGKGGKENGLRNDEVKINGQVLVVCRSYNTKEGCKRADCKFAHVCNVHRSDGRLCGGKHPATEHRGAKH